MSICKAIYGKYYTSVQIKSQSIRFLLFYELCVLSYITHWFFPLRFA
jgi:hypothetical protein